MRDIKKFGMQTKQFQLPIFNPGKQLKYNNQICTVDHVRVKEFDLKIKFKELNDDVDSKELDCEPTIFMLK
jgi:hypothetical protein